MKRLQIPQKLGTKNFTYTKKFYVHKIAAVDFSKIYFLKNANKACKPNNRDLNSDWMISKIMCHFPYFKNIFHNVRAMKSHFVNCMSHFLFEKKSFLIQGLIRDKRYTVL